MIKSNGPRKKLEFISEAHTLEDVPGLVVSVSYPDKVRFPLHNFSIGRIGNDQQVIPFVPFNRIQDAKKLLDHVAALYADKIEKIEKERQVFMEQKAKAEAEATKKAEALTHSLKGELKRAQRAASTDLSTAEKNSKKAKEANITMARRILDTNPAQPS